MARIDAAATAAASFAHTVTSGPLLLAALVSALVGVLGFLSPCVLPLVPGYLSYVAGLTGEARGTAPSQRRMVGGALLFVAGFTAIFVAQGALFGQLGASIQLHYRPIEIVLGTVVIVLGVVFVGGLGFLQREFKIHRLPRPGLLGAPLLGLAFGLAWTPCLTPTFAAVSSLAAREGTAGRGALLTVFYCLGLGIPFVLVALGFGWVTRLLGFLRSHTRAVSIVGGVLLVTLGVLLVTGEWDTLIREFQGQVGAGGIDV